MADIEPRRSNATLSKIEKLPPDVKSIVDGLLSDSSNSYTYIADWLNEQGYEISYGSVGRYARRMQKNQQRLAENLELTKQTLEFLAENPNLDTAKAAQAIMVDGLIQRISTADAEFYEFPLDKAMRLVADIRRIEISEKKLLFDMRKKIDLALEGLESKLMAAINNDPDAGPKIKSALQEFIDKVNEDEYGIS